ncbi:methionine adenosyltransferase [Phenylobacterium soli]|uniref:S-adenosylmethionine synthase n=1 Tax=Phenylobacterium soli TaxID=2170551 RepID=A0A328AH40_9CAUL|nr:methionine adenosyltransferase [Phenylobacterium soli]RAK54102.1 S-adenosylmethionine synthase [Phenylobacterium soli]
MRDFVLTPLASSASVVEVVERKGAGHPDTICDALAEQLSRDLCRAYRERFGTILHHNVDKALLSAGRSAPAFGGGRVERPLEIYLAGRATTTAGGKDVPVADIAIEGARRWLGEHLHALDVDRHARIHPVIHPGSADLQGLFNRGAADVPRANDTSIGVGYAPLSPLEQLVLAVDAAIAARAHANGRPAWGEDTKVMGVRIGAHVRLTISCALIGRHLADLDAYLAETAAIERLAVETAGAFPFESCEVTVNAGDRPEAGEVYLTVTGTSAEAGDDGQVGRGNRINGLITPGRPMSLEAAAGKNPVSHVGKIYNVAARDIARRIVETIPGAARAECLLVSQIGAPITEPAVVEVRIDHPARDIRVEVHDAARAIAAETLGGLGARVEAFVSGEVGLY